jgi:hypothetical protein
MDTTVKLDLMETGTRYEHYLELRDAFATGIVILSNQSQYEEVVNQTTRANIKKLEGAVDLIESRVNFLSEYKTKMASHSDLAKLIRSIPPNRLAQLPEVSESTRRECEDEMRKAGETGYAEDVSQKSAETNKGTSPEEPK